MKLNKKSENDKSEKIKYNVLFVPDSDTAAVKKISIQLEYIMAFFAGLAFLIIVAFVYCFIVTAKINTTGKTIADLNVQLKSLMEENTTIKAENKELKDKVAILSDTVNDKVQKEEEVASTYVPTGFPLAGTASIDESNTVLDGNPIVNFSATVGTKVLSTGSGTVFSIENSASEYIVTVNHENGYFSVYRNGSKPRVKEGDIVTNITELFIIEDGKEKLGYQIKQNGRYIDPLVVMEIYG